MLMPVDDVAVERVSSLLTFNHFLYFPANIILIRLQLS